MINNKRFKKGEVKIIFEFAKGSEKTANRVAVV